MATINGTAGNDTLNGTGDADTLNGLGGNDVIVGEASNDNLVGGPGDDTMYGGAGDDTGVGDLGDDWFYADVGNDRYDGGDSLDHVVYIWLTGPVVVDLVAGTATKPGGGVDTLVSIGGIDGTTFADTLLGSDSDEIFQPDLGDDSIDGRGGFDQLFYGGAPSAVQVDLQAGTATGGRGDDRFVNIEGVAGSAHADLLRGRDGEVDLFFPDAIILGGESSGADTVDGRGGNDVVSYVFEPAAVQLNLAAGTARDGRGFIDSLISIETAYGSSFADTLVGDAGSNQLYGDAGDDLLDGGGGIDTVDGGAGNDTAVLAGNRALYRVSQPSEGTLRLVNTASGTDFMATAVELFQFSDGTRSVAQLLANNAPVQTGSFALEVVEDTPLTFTAASLLSAFSDPDGDPLTLTLPTTLAGLVNNGNGSWTYTPGSNVGGVSFLAAGTATVSDGRGGVLNVQLGINISAVNDAPALTGVWDGRATLNVRGTEYAMAALPQGDGRILVGGSFTNSAQTGFMLVRLEADGSRDIAFGSPVGAGAGVQLVGSGNTVGVRAVQAADGSVVMAAQLQQGGSGNLRDWAAVRFNADGSPDAFFNNGLGSLVLDISNTDSLRALALGTGGKIVLAGFSRPTGATSDVATVVRLNANGTLDTTFGAGNGYVTVDLAVSFAERIEAVLVQPDGKIVAAGRVSVSGGSHFAVMRLNSDGTLDAGFGSGGRLVVADPAGASASGRALHLLGDGSFYVAGATVPTGGLSQFVLMHVSASGVLDTGFGSAGFARAAFADHSAEAYSIQVQADGRILLSGEASGSGIGKSAVARFTSAGVLDTGYGSAGTQLVPFASTFGAGVGSALDAQGRLITVGQSGSDFALARLTPAGQPDASFNPQPALQNRPAGQVITLTTGELLRGFTDAEGNSLEIDTLSAVGASDVSGADGVWRITPQAGRLGPFTVSYVVKDPGGAQTLATREFFLTGAGDSRTGTEGPDALTGDAGNDTLAGLGGADMLTGAAGGDSLVGGAGNDTLFGGDGSSGVPGVGDGADRLDGGDGDDMLRGNAGNDTLLGGGGDDNLRGDTGSDQLIGGDGIDFVSYRFDEDAAWPGGTPAALLIDWSGLVPGATFTLSDGLGGTDTLEGIETFGLTGGRLDDTITGSPARDQISGWLGNDLINGGEGNDTLAGDSFSAMTPGNDTLIGDAGNDGYIYEVMIAGGQVTQSGGFDVIRNLDGSGSGNDRLWMTSVPIGHIHGYREGTSFVFSVQAGTQWSDPPQNAAVGAVTIEGLFSGSPGAIVDRVDFADAYGLISYQGSVGIYGLELYAVPGDALLHRMLIGIAGSSMFGTADAEEFRPGPGAFEVDGLGGNDTVSYMDDGIGGSSGVQVNLASGTVTDTGGGSGTLRSIEHVVGSRQADSIVGDGLDNTLEGREGDDTLRGGEGNDTLEPDAGNDLVDGGEGYDFADYRESLAALTVDLAVGSATGTSEGSDTLASIEQVHGSPFADLMLGSDRELGTLGNEGFTGGGGNDTLRGLGSSDFLAGDEGDDSLEGGEGNDSLDGGEGSDRIDGGPGTDTLEHWRTGHLGGTVVDLQAGTAVHAGEHDTISGIENVDGSFALGDTLLGDGSPNRLRGWGGNDLLEGRAGPDTLEGGDGADTLVAGLGDDVADGGSGDDVVLLPFARSEVVVETVGTEQLRLVHAGGSVVLRQVELVGFTDQGVSVATLIADLAVNRSGTAAADNLVGGAGNDTLAGLGGSDTLDGGAGDDSLSGGDGDDWFTASTGNDTLDGGAGTDRANYQGFGAAIRVDMAAGTVQKGAGSTAGALGTDRLSGIERVVGTAFDDELLGSNAADDFTGGPGNDTLDGRGGNDFLWYGRATGPIVVDLAAGLATGGEGSDVLISIEQVAGGPHADELRGNALNNYFRGDAGDFTGVSTGADTIDGRGGFDTVDYRDDTGAVQIDLQAGTGRDGRGFTDVLISIEHAFGGPGNDLVRGRSQPGNDPESLVGRGGNDTLEGLGGHDFLSGQDGNDSLLGGDGNDTLWAGRGVDTVDGGEGSDEFQTPGPRADYTVLRPGGGELRLVHVNQSEDILLRRVESVRFTDETVSVAMLGNPFVGGPGPDAVSGNGEANRLEGGGGNDTIAAGPGDDFIVGGTGNDTIDGGEGFDIASWAGSTLPVSVNLQAGSATSGSDADTLSGIEAVFGSAFNDTLRGRDGPANDRGETLRGSGGDDSIDGGSGVDAVEYLGNRRDYTVTRNPDGSFTVRDNNLADGDDGTDRLVNVERLVFADEMLAFGSRADEVARVAAVLWTPAILTNPGIFSRGLSFYDNGQPAYSFEQLCLAALNFWTSFSDAELATRLRQSSGTSKSDADLLATMAAAGGGMAGRAAALAEAALDPGTTLVLANSGLRETGYVAVNYIPEFGWLFTPWPELPA